MYRIPNRRAIIDRRDLVQELEEQAGRGADSARVRANALQIFKAALYRGVGEIRRRFEDEDIRGPEVVHSNSFLVDQLVRCIYDFAAKHVYPIADAKSAGPGEMAILATGGYGRGELSPFSDIDLMFLLPPQSRPDNEKIIEYILYMLWDCGLQVGHATRTVEDCVTLARADLTIRSCLLESRWLWGNGPLYDAFDDAFWRKVAAGTGAAFVESKLAERDLRHARMGDSRYVLEPNIKEGKGGLRDLQTLFWIAKYLYRVKDMAELVERGIFTLADVRHFKKSQDFLWTVRCHLHYVSGRPEERLTFNVQDIIAKRIGYGDRAGARGVERFMKHYFRVTKTVGDLTRILCAVLEEEQKKPRRRFRIPMWPLFRRMPEGFRLDGERLNFHPQDAIMRDPVKMLRLFHIAQHFGLDIHPRALRMIQQNLKLIDKHVRADSDANRLFVEMLTSANDPETTLKRMNDAGVFGRFIPDFGRVVAQMQYDMYHVYTVDEHTIHAIGILHGVETGKFTNEHPAASEAAGDIRSRRALYIAVLLHDVAKGRGGDHSELGAGVAEQLAPRLGLDAWETETVVWLIRYHLLMSRTAFKRDIDNPKTVTDFVDLVQSPERLRMLLLLTDVDIHAVGPGIWNNWKAGLLGDLYYRALEVMEMPGGQPMDRRVERAKARLRARLPDWEEKRLETYLARGYSDYWLAFGVESHVQHFELMRKAEDAKSPLSIEARQHPSHDVTEVILYAPDHPGLFARIAGAMALSGASIVDAKIITLANSMALDTFWIQDVSGRAFDSLDRLDRLKKRIEEAIVGRLHPGRELKAVRERALPSRTRVFTVPPAVFFDNKASVTHTVIEVNGRDRLGFLHDVTSTLTSVGLQITSAHISTYGERVVDVFYVKDVFGLKIDDKAKLAQIEQRLLEAIAAPDDGARIEDADAATVDGAAAG